MTPRFDLVTATAGWRIGRLASGATGSIHDVPGFGLGHFTLILDEPDPPAGRGVVRTGISVLHVSGDGFGSPVPAGGAVLNGMGECTGFLTVSEWGRCETPVFLTSTMQVGRVYDAACTLLARRDPRVGVEDVVIPVVGECDDSGLSDPRWARLSDEQVAFAWQQAEDAAALSGTAQAQAPAEGCVGAGTGMEALGFKAGIGTASRILPDGHVMGAVVLANFGSRERLRIAGRRIPDDRVPETTAGSARDRGDRGSCIVVLATNAPLDHHGCTRLARRAGLGLANAGSVGAHGSGEIFLALATGLRGDRRSPASGAPISGSDLDVYFEAAADSTEEAVANSLLAATAMEGREGRRIEALALNRVHRAVH